MPRPNLLALVYFLCFHFHIRSTSSFVSPNNLINGSEACDLDWTYFEPTNKCYKVIVDDMNWDQAVQTCVNMDSIIVSIHSRQHNEFLINMTLSIQPPNITEMYAFWIGYYETYNASRWMNAYYLTNFQWLDGSMMNFVNWAIIYLGTYEPDYYYFAYTPLQANRSCAVLLADYHGHTTYWRLIKTTWFDDDYGCESMYSGTICQRDSKVSLSITENNDLEFTCDKGWIENGVTNILNRTKHMCYKYVYQRQMDYYDAVQRCESMNSTIVYIENEDETNFLITKVVDQKEISNPYSLWYLHIGLIDYNNSGIWRWPDGAPADFVKWYANQPQYGGKVNNISCAYLVYGEKYQMVKGKIIQSDCNVAHERTICKKSAIPRKKFDNSTVSIIGLNDLNAGKITPITYPTNISSLMEKYYSIRSTGVYCTNDSSAPCPLEPFVCPLSGKQHVNIVDTDSSTLCGPGWTYFNRTNKCYQIVLKDMNLFAAIETCNSLNSTLASIHGESHNDFLISMARSLPTAANTSFYALWIGFMNYEHAFEYMTGNYQLGWSWSDGSVVDYVRWTRYMPIDLQCDEGWTHYELKNNYGDRYNMCYYNLDVMSMQLCLWVNFVEAVTAIISIFVGDVLSMMQPKILYHRPVDT
uniref:C-type lectin domain-containing protein n=1 Tax=Acrobeloides nanus TaxID=290746 RepID=A0A914DMK5_9BILA